MFTKKTRIFSLLVLLGTIPILLLGCNQPTSLTATNPAASTGSQDSSFSTWDSIQLTYGLNGEVIELSEADQLTLSNLILNFQFQEFSSNEDSTGETLYGGPVFTALFVDGNTSYRWRFTVNMFSKTITKDGIIAEQYTYESNEMLLQKLEAFR